jgi:cytochrome c
LKLLYPLTLLSFLFIGCTEEPKVDAKELLVTSCAKCHNLSMPPVIPEYELAPPMMAIAFHLKNFIKTINPGEHKHDFSSFVADYVRFPSKDKSYCDEVSIKTYGLMPSLEHNLTHNEAYQIAEYIYNKYDEKKFYKEINAKKIFEAKPKGEQIALQNGCMSCHNIYTKKIAPSFKNISKLSNKKDILNSLQKGSKGKYKEFTKSYMPPLGKNMCKNDLEELSKWILSL